jgi:hypothetical protein
VASLVVHVYLTGAQAVTIDTIDDSTLVAASILHEPGGRTIARIVGPPGELWALVTALSQALADYTGQPSTAIHPVTVVVEPLYSADPPDE